MSEGKIKKADKLMNGFSRMMAAILVMILVALVLSACTPTKSYSESKEKEVVKDLIELATGDTTVREFEPLMVKELDRVSEEGAAELIDGYLYVVFQSVDKLGEKSSAFQRESEDWYKKEKDVDNDSDRESVENRLFETYLEEVRDSRLKIVQLDQLYTVQPNYSLIIDKYKEYMTDEMLRYVELSMEEVDAPFYNTLTDEVDFDVLADRIVTIMDMQRDFPNSIYADSLVLSEKYYREVYFGWQNEFVIGLDDRVKEDVLKSYKEKAKNLKGHAFSDELKELIRLLEINENEVTEEVSEYLDVLVQNDLEPPLQHEVIYGNEKEDDEEENNKEK